MRASMAKIAGKGFPLCTPFRKIARAGESQQQIYFSAPSKIPRHKHVDLI